MTLYNEGNSHVTYFSILNFFNVNGIRGYSVSLQYIPSFPSVKKIWLKNIIGEKESKLLMILEMCY